MEGSLTYKSDSELPLPPPFLFRSVLHPYSIYLLYSENIWLTQFLSEFLMYCSAHREYLSSINPLSWCLLFYSCPIAILTGLEMALKKYVCVCVCVYKGWGQQEWIGRGERKMRERGGMG